MSLRTSTIPPTLEKVLYYYIMNLSVWNINSFITKYGRRAMIDLFKRFASVEGRLKIFETNKNKHLIRETIFNDQVLYPLFGERPFDIARSLPCGKFCPHHKDGTEEYPHTNLSTSCLRCAIARREIHSMNAQNILYSI